MPGPATLKMKGTFDLDLPAAIAEDVGVPPVALGTLDFALEVKAIQAAPVRSRFEGRLVLEVTHPDKTRTYVNVVADLNGEQDGPPLVVLARALEQLGGVTAFFCPPTPEEAAEFDPSAPTPDSR